MLALLATFALFAAASAERVCNTATKGITTGVPKPLRTVTLDADTPTYDVHIPADSCAPGQVVGTTLTACDEDVAPDVYLTDILNGVVVRKKYDKDGELFTTVYCS